jgi:hypothetical protein
MKNEAQIAALEAERARLRQEYKDKSDALLRQITVLASNAKIGQLYTRPDSDGAVTFLLQSIDHEKGMMTGIYTAYLNELELHWMEAQPDEN